MNPEGTVIFDAAAEAVYERSGTHGEPEDTFATIADLWNAYLRAGGVQDPNIDAEDVGNLMILLKVARNAGGHYEDDNYVDIAGYAENAARLRCDADEDQ